jgi:uncharacterized membrane protein HdeD (DUF308 family)
VIVTNPFTPTGALREVSRSWWVLLTMGIMSVVAGGIILSVDWQLEDLASFIGAVLVVRGMFTMLTLPLDGSERGWAVAQGLLEIAIGVMVWVWPEPTLLVVAWTIGWYVMFSGVTTIAGAISGRDVLPYWGFMVVLGILEVGVSFWLLARPGITLVAAVLAIGLWCILYGVALTVLSFDVKRLGNVGEGPDSDSGADRRLDLSKQRDVQHALH